MALNTWVVSIMKYVAVILKWNKNEPQEINRKIRKSMTMNKELYQRSDVVSRKNGGRGLIEWKQCEERRKSLGRYVKNNIEPLLAAVRTNRILTHVDTVDSTEFKKIKEEQRKHEWTEKRMLV